MLRPNCFGVVGSTVRNAVSAPRLEDPNREGILSARSAVRFRLAHQLARDAAKGR